MKMMNDKYKTNNTLSYQTETPGPNTLVCFSHLRWDFVYQRPQHLLSRFASVYTVYFVEEPVFEDIKKPFLTIISKSKNLSIVKSHLPHESQNQADEIQKTLLDNFLKAKKSADLIFWYYTPMALKFSSHFKPALCIYDCMDELSNFKFAPPELIALEDELLKKADIVFTGGRTLYEYKKHKHKNIFAFPSSIDKSHFEQARKINNEPNDQLNIKGTKLGFYGVLDERFDINLIKEIAVLRPDWNIILLGPTAKIDADSLPQLPNVHLLGGKSYQQLPQYLSGWDIALIPFVIDDSTKFISPTKTPEYLAAGVPVISTAIQDVINPYGNAGVVKIASTAQGFVNAAESYLKLDKSEWLPRVDELLADVSWDITFGEMVKQIKNTHINISGRKKNVSQISYKASLPGTLNLKTDVTQQSATG